ncbi:MAG: YqgE/AlgH family protein [Phycisphaerae bacterium]|nr:YqgE/AlgH family protein [Phycisphaerae bacterium]
MSSLQGQLLIASPDLEDPNFHQTVLLMVEHTPESALGLILNRPLDVTVQDAWDQASTAPCLSDGPLHQGGPCESPLMVLHSFEEAAQVKVAEGIYFSTEQANVEWLVSQNLKPCKFFVGCAGWGPGQLESELDEESWLAIPAEAADVFTAVPNHWQQLIRRIQGSLVFPGMRPDHLPDDPASN